MSSEVEWINDTLYPDQLQNLYNWRSMANKGVLLAAGSDSPVEPVNPFLGIRSAVLRQNLDLWPPEGFNPGEKLTVKEMLKAYTYSSAYQYFEESFKGCIKPGSYADLVVLSKDPLNMPLLELDKIEVVLSFVAGRMVYQKEDCNLGYSLK